VIFSISGGLDRRINLVLKNTSGEVLSESTSSKINTDDQFTIEGKNYFGKLITLSFPSDGDYTIEANMLSYNGDIVQTDKYQYIVDAVRPIITREIKYTPRAYQSPLLYNSFAQANFNNLSIEVGSDFAGIEKANLLVKKEVKNSSLGRLKAHISEDGTRVSFMSYPSSLISGDGNYTISFEVFDRAGNVTTSTLSTFAVDNVRPEMVFSHAYNPITDHWDDYVPGMTVHSNPVKMRIRRKKAEHSDFNGVGDNGWDNSRGNKGYQYTDENYIYNDFNVYSPAAYTYITFLTKSSIWKRLYQNSAKIVMSEGVPLAPKLDKVSLKVQEEGDYRPGSRPNLSINMSTPTTITDIRVKVEPRNYEQTVYILRGGGACVIPASEIECNISINELYDSGSGYSAKPIFLKSSVNGVQDGKFNFHAAYVHIYHDFNGGEFLSHNMENKKIDFTYSDPDRANDWKKLMWETLSIKLHAENTIDSAVTVINLDEYVETTYNQYKGSVDASGLAEGNYNLYLVATDTYSNVTKQLVVENMLIDNIAPKITIMDKGLESFSEVFDLDNIDIILEDIDTADITEIILKEGPLNNVVNMSWREIENKSFKLEYPEIFPSLTDDEKYKLIVKANDSSGNTSEKEMVFIYKPLDLHEKEPIHIITTTELLRNKEGLVVNHISEKNIRNKDGLLASGSYVADFTLSVTSEFSIIYKGKTVNPGQTLKTTVILKDGELSLTIMQADKVEGTIKYLLDIPNI
jgi:hypothetical protein